MNSANPRLAISLVIVWIASGLAIPVLGATDETAPLINFISRFQVFRIFSFDFTQENRNVTTDQTIRASGEVTLAPPARFRWNYASKPQNILASDGIWMMMVLPGDRQVMLESAVGNPAIWSPISLLSDPNSIEHEFEVKADESVPEGKYRFNLKPRTEDKPFSGIEFEFAKNFDRIEFSLTITDLAGNKNHLEFAHFRSLDKEIEFLPPIPRNADLTDFSGRTIDRKDPRYGQLRKE